MLRHCFFVCFLILLKRGENMKKKLLVLTLIGVFSLFLMSGCSVGERTLTCTMEETEEEITTVQTMTSTFQDGKLSKVNVNMEMTLGEIYDGYVESAKSSVDEQFADLVGAEGVSYSSGLNLDERKITVTVDADIATMDENSKILLNIQDADMDETYEESKEYFESNGYTCE